MKYKGYVTGILTGLALDWLKQRDPSKPFLLMLGQKAPHRTWEPDPTLLHFDHGRNYPKPPTLFDDYSGRGAAGHEQNMMVASTLNREDLKRMQGRSLLPLLAGHAPTDWRQSFYCHYYEYPTQHNVPRQYGVVTARYKLVRFHKLKEPAFDHPGPFALQKDPNEMKSAYGEPEYAGTVTRLQNELTRLSTKLKVPAQDPPGSLLPHRKKAPPKKVE